MTVSSRLFSARRAARWLPLACLVVLIALPLLAEEMDLEKDEDYDNYFKETRASWILSPAANGGYNKLGKGYKGYEDLGNAGLDLYFRPPKPTVEAPAWYDRMMFRMSVDYFPLQVPEGVYGVTEDVYSLNFGILYKFMSFLREERKQWNPFLGAGIGMYWDRLSVKAPGVSASGATAYWGANASLGLFSPGFGRFRLVPEIRYHAMKTPNNFIASNTTYQMGLVYWLEPKVYD